MEWSMKNEGTFGMRDLVYLGVIVLMGFWGWMSVRRLEKVANDIEDVRIRSSYIYQELQDAGGLLRALDSLGRLQEDGPIYNINRYYYEVLSVSRSDVSGDTLVARVNELLKK